MSKDEKCPKCASPREREYGRWIVFDCGSEANKDTADFKRSIGCSWNAAGVKKDKENPDA